jgi:hypothetical protein
MEIVIKSVENGYTLTVPAISADESTTTHVFQIDDMKEDGELDASLELLYALIDQLGVYGSKHDKRRLRVEIVNQNEDEELSRLPEEDDGN